MKELETNFKENEKKLKDKIKKWEDFLLFHNNNILVEAGKHKYPYDFKQELAGRIVIGTQIKKDFDDFKEGKLEKKTDAKKDQEGGKKDKAAGN